ncbi:MAG: hypothetical protein WC222_07730 [Parachlamydiales bacterium]
MKYFLSLCTFFAVFFSGLSAREPEAFLTYRPTIFVPFSNDFRKTIGEGLFANQFEGGFFTYPDWSVWGNVSYLSRTGDLSGFRDSAKIQLLTLSAGASYHFAMNIWNCEGYLGVGPLYGKANFVDPRQDRDNVNLNRDALGAIVKFGFIYHFQRCAQLDLFCDYQQLVVKSHVRSGSTKGNLTLSGLNTGIGLGIVF